MPGRRAGVAEPEEGVGLEEELGDRRGGAGIDLALEPRDVGAVVGGLGVRLGIGAGADREAPGLGQRRDQLGRVCEALGMRLESARRIGRIAPQRHDLGHAGLGVARRRWPASPRGWRRRR